MHWDVKTVKPLPDFRLYVETADGRKGIFDMTPYLGRGVFRQLQDRAYFDRVGIVLAAVTWPDGQDIAPDTLLAEMTAVQELPAWN